jgi:hypothetical protein
MDPIIHSLLANQTAEIATRRVASGRLRRMEFPCLATNNAK